MEIKPEYEVFGREVPFEKITPIKQIFQPGIISASHFFSDPKSIRDALNELHWISKEEILVYFLNFSGGMFPNVKSKDRKWWDSLHDLISKLGKDSIPMELEYYYGSGTGKDTFTSPEFNEDKPPYQAFLNLFNNALQFFSCFVGENKEGIRFNSTRSNYCDAKPGEALILDQKTLWKGSSEDFQNIASTIRHAFYLFGNSYEINVAGYNFDPPEIRIISPRRGALVSRLVGSDGATILISEKTLEEITKTEMERRKEFVKLPN